MTGFCFPQPDLRPVGEGRYILLGGYRYVWSDRGLDKKIVVPVGLETDGASVPRLLWTITGLTPDGPIRAAALVHDFLYRHGGKLPEGALLGRNPSGAFIPLDHYEFTRAEADGLFHQIMLQSGISARKAWLAWAGVRMGGWTAWGKNHRQTRLAAHGERA